jgi:1-acyl-sn-glycerol-3-phosphate acyltransferase
VIVYGLARVILPILFRLKGVRLVVEGRENVPEHGPFVLVANHGSNLDALLAQVACPRSVWSMAKSSQFRHPVTRWLLVHLNGFPTRRYQVDPQAVRTALRVIERGGGLGLYPEGERSWDGSLQPLRTGSVRFLLKVGVPLLPCGISGSYALQPRWSRSIGRGPARVRFGRPFELGRHDSRAARDAAVEEATSRIRTALAALVDEEVASEGRSEG